MTVKVVQECWYFSNGSALHWRSCNIRVPAIVEVLQQWRYSNSVGPETMDVLL